MSNTHVRTGIRNRDIAKMLLTNKDNYKGQGKANKMIALIAITAFSVAVPRVEPLADFMFTNAPTVYGYMETISDMFLGESSNGDY